MTAAPQRIDVRPVAYDALAERDTGPALGARQPDPTRSMK